MRIGHQTYLLTKLPLSPKTGVATDEMDAE
jgi:hypothetical protein